jgi:hypothetical protein
MTGRKQRQTLLLLKSKKLEKKHMPDSTMTTVSGEVREKQLDFQQVSRQKSGF